MARHGWRRTGRVSSASFDKDTYDVSNLKDESTDLAYAERLTAELEENGVTVLKNEYVMVDAGGQQTDARRHR